MLKLFIDGEEGTTGLQIAERLRSHLGIELLKIDPALRKKPAARAECINAADGVVLCLPDAAARESVALCKNPDTVIFDASTAHRTHPDWAYGFPELSLEHLGRVRTQNRITVPGCHATGFSALIYPLRRAGLIWKNAQLPCWSLTGYSGGGKSMIAEYESAKAPRDTRPYALDLKHKHLPEMMAVCDLENAPFFTPAVVPVQRGMLVGVPLLLPEPEVRRVLTTHYNTQSESQVCVLPAGVTDQNRLGMETMNNTDDMQILLFGDADRTLAVARFDNLGKGATGAALRCIRLRFGL